MPGASQNFSNEGTESSGSCEVTESGTRPLERVGGLLAFATKGNQSKGIRMRKTLLSIALAVAAPFAWAQTSSTTTTTTTTEGGGTITEYTPGSVITLKETSGPRNYKFSKKVVYVTKSGKELDEATVKTRIKIGIPVHVHYMTEGDNMMVDRVILDED